MKDYRSRRFVMAGHAAMLLILLLAFGVARDAAAQTTILPIGDSITRGTQGFPFATGQYPESDYRLQGGGPPNDLRSYREHLHDMLADSSCGANVEWLGAQRLAGRTPEIHQGISGWRFNDYLNDNKNWPNQTGLYPNGDNWTTSRWLEEFDAEIVLMKLGTNDIGRGESPGSTADGLEDMLDKIYAANADSTVFVANLIPIEGWNGDHRYISPYDSVDVDGNVDVYNSLAANIVSQEQANGRDVHLVDVNSGFYVNEGNPVSCPAETGGDSNNMSLKLCFTQPGGSASIPDGIHPGLLGERFIAERMFTALQNETSVCGGGGGPDTQAPVTFVDTPSGNGQTFGANPVFDGTATDAGGSGFDRIRIVVRDNDANPVRWLNFSTGQFEVQNGNLPDEDATLTNTSTSSTDWSVSIPLSTPGNYELFALGYDNAGNDAFSQGGNWTQRQFQIAATDTQAASVTISSPSANDVLTTGAVSIAGAATDAGGSGFRYVQIGIYDAANARWHDFDTGGFSASFRSRRADLSDLTTSTTDWAADAPLLPAGSYIAYVRAMDNAGNIPRTGAGRLRWIKRNFFVQDPGAPDTEAPRTIVATPAINATLPAGSDVALSGRSADDGGSGFRYVQLAVYDLGSATWFDFASGNFTASFASRRATLFNTEIDRTDWELSASLPPGSYRLYARTVDNAGNIPRTPADRLRWNKRNFSVVP